MSADGGEVAPTFSIILDGDGVKVKKSLDQETARRVITLIMGGETPDPAPLSQNPPRRRPKKKASAKGGKSAKRRQASVGVVKDLSLRPKGKEAFADFAEGKKPKTHMEKQAVAVFWLQHVAGAKEISVDHINTCYLNAKWKRPKDLPNNLAVTSIRKGWLDTSDMSNIQLTVPGEDLVNHELPPQEK